MKFTRKGVFTLLFIAVVGIVSSEPAKALDPNNVYIYGIIDYQTVERVVPVIRHVNKSRPLVVHVNSPGGLISAGKVIINELHRSGCVLIISIEGEASSMAFDIVISGDYVVVKRLDNMVVHAGFMPIEGAVNNMKLLWYPGSQAEQEKQKQDYKGYLTKEEEKFIFERGGDLFLDEATFMERVDNSTTHLQRL